MLPVAMKIFTDVADTRPHISQKECVHVAVVGITITKFSGLHHITPGPDSRGMHCQPAKKETNSETGYSYRCCRE